MERKIARILYSNPSLFSGAYHIFNCIASLVSEIINGSSELKKKLVSQDQFGKPFESEEEAARAAANFPQKYGGGRKFY